MENETRLDLFIAVGNAEPGYIDDLEAFIKVKDRPACQLPLGIQKNCTRKEAIDRTIKLINQYYNQIEKEANADLRVSV